MSKHLASLGLPSKDNLADYHPGNANIRPVYGFDTKVAGFTAQEQSQEGTFGYIFQVSAVDLEAVRKGYRGTRVMLTTNIDVALNHCKSNRLTTLSCYYSRIAFPLMYFKGDSLLNRHPRFSTTST